MAETLVQTILDGDYAGLKNTVEKVIAKKLHNRILAEKTKVIAKFNGISSTKMADIIAQSMKK